MSLHIGRVRKMSNSVHKAHHPKMGLHKKHIHTVKAIHKPLNLMHPQ